MTTTTTTQAVSARLANSIYPDVDVTYGVVRTASDAYPQPYEIVTSMKCFDNPEFYSVVFQVYRKLKDGEIVNGGILVVRYYDPAIPMHTLIANKLGSELEEAMGEPILSQTSNDVYVNDYNPETGEYDVEYFGEDYIVTLH